jgi:hypothetical protein
MKHLTPKRDPKKMTPKRGLGGKIAPAAALENIFEMKTAAPSSRAQAQARKKA